ncbi:MAG: hypothetical protein OXI75_10665 [Rhodospirillales bacterium]|nr:hypothetical protein [Rhodospirillales bacterium]
MVYVAGKLQTRKWRKDGEDSDRFSTEILLVPDGRVQFLDRPVGTNGNGAQASDGARIDAAGAHGHARVENTREDIRGGTPIEKAGGHVLHCLDNSAQPDALGAGRQPCSDAVQYRQPKSSVRSPIPLQRPEGSRGSRPYRRSPSPRSGHRTSPTPRAPGWGSHP